MVFWLQVGRRSVADVIQGITFPRYIEGAYVKTERTLWLWALSTDLVVGSLIARKDSACTQNYIMTTETFTFVTFFFLFLMQVRLWLLILSVACGHWQIGPFL